MSVITVMSDVPYEAHSRRVWADLATAADEAVKSTVFRWGKTQRVWLLRNRVLKKLQRLAMLMNRIYTAKTKRVTIEFYCAKTCQGYARVAKKLKKLPATVHNTTI
jgi:hypothetical protein